MTAHYAKLGTSPVPYAKSMKNKGLLSLDLVNLTPVDTRFRDTSIPEPGTSAEYLPAEDERLTAVLLHWLTGAGRVTITRCPPWTN